MADKQPYLDALRELLAYELPPDVRERVTFLLGNPGASAYELRSACRRAAERTVLSYPRSEIVWHPTVDAVLCTGCGRCFDFCPQQVYEMADGLSRVAQPERCVILCSECAPLCPAGAVTFPPQTSYHEFLKPREEEC